MIYINYQDVDVPVEILEYIGKDRVRVQSIVGFPFGPDTPSARNRLIARRHQNIAIVKREQIKVVQDG